MRINKMFFGLLGMLAMMFVSCSENKDDDYNWATVSGEQVFFSNELPATVELSRTSNTFSIPVKRMNSDGAVTVSVTATDPSGLFTIPSSVTFNAGQTETNLVIGYTYDVEKFPFDEFKNLEIMLGGEELTTPYGKSVYKFEAGVPSPLEFLGIGTFLEGFWFEWESKNVEIYQNTENRNEYRIKDPFDVIVAEMAEEGQTVVLNGHQSKWLTFTVLQPGQEVAGLTISQKDLVFFSELNTGYFHSSYEADVLMLHPWEFSSLRSESAGAFNKVLSWQENGLPGQVQLAPYYYMDGIGGWNNTKKDGVVMITFPDYVPKDYTMVLNYEGIFTNADGVTSAVASIELGEDATNVVAVVVPADADAGAVADAIAAGDLEGTEVSGSYASAPIPEDMSGKLQMVVVVLDDGVAKVVDSVFFEYYGGGAEPWTSLGIGYWTDDMVLPLFGNDPYTYEVEIQESTETPGLYKVVSAYAPVAAGFEVPGGDKDIEINAEDPNFVYILDQEVGLDLGYGSISIETDAGYYISQYGFDAVKEQLPDIFGKLSNGELTFPVLEGKNSKGEAVDYQIWVNMGGSSYFGGRNGLFKVVLPSASAGTKKKAKSLAKASEFEIRLKGLKFNGNKTKEYYRILKQKPRSFDSRVK